MNTKFSKILETLRNYQNPRNKDERPTVYIVSNSIFIKGSYVRHDNETITLSSFSCLGLNVERVAGTMVILLDSLSVLGTTLSTETEEN